MQYRTWKYEVGLSQTSFSAIIHMYIVQPTCCRPVQSVGSITTPLRPTRGTVGASRKSPKEAPHLTGSVHHAETDIRRKL